MRSRAIIAAGLVLVVLAGAAVALATVRRDPCGGFRVDPVEWRTASGARRQEIAEKIVRCDTFARATRATVYGTLGGGRELLGTWELRTDYTGLSSTQLRIQFGDDDRVRSVRIVQRYD